MTYQYFDWTAFREADLLKPGDHDLGTGDTFTMPGSATICMTAKDNDYFLSGDSYDNATDHSYQTASIEDDGGEIGNRGQIYAENYFWVHDQHGNWYVMVEIEQEGSHDDYFTFYTGGGYSVPPAGATLTVGSKCNVTSNWIDYKCLDAGDKAPTTGAISGIVFCDVDCDGINGEKVIIEGHDYEVEAEHMSKYGFKTVHGDQASGGELVKLNGYVGGDDDDDDDDDDDGGSGAKLWTHFSGKDGTYDIKVHAQDENDGQSHVKLYVNGDYKGTVKLDRDDDGGGSNHGGFSTFVIKDVEMHKGDEIKLVAYGDGGEYVRIDKMVMEGKDKHVVTEEPVKEGVTVKLLDASGAVVATTTTDADGTYSFDGIEPGDYQIMGVAPDGTEFTIQDVGSDDSIDSDVDATGTSGPITVTAGSHTDVDLGVCDIKAGAISGTVFCDLDCDGINGEVVITPGHDYRIEAEDMHEYGFHTVHGAQASGGRLVKLDHAGGDGKLWTHFTGKDGTYDIKICVQDENDGQSMIKLKVNGHLVDAIKLDQDDDGGGSNNGGFSTYVIPDVPINHGDELKLVAWGNGHEFVRIDKIDLIGEDTTIFTPEPTKEGVTIKLLDAAGNVVATTVTDADGNYRFDDVPVGDYKVMGVAPDGTEFAPQDVGTDDTIDSDVDATGTSAVITVSDGSETDVDLGICDKPLGSIAGRYFCDENRDDIDNGEPGVVGLTVTLLDGDGNVVDTTTTDANGDYLFDNLEAGDYAVSFAREVGKDFVAPNVGNDEDDSDVTDFDSDGIGSTRVFTLAEGEDKRNVDAGIAKIFRVCDDPDAVLIDFEELDAGTVIDDEYADIGVLIEAQRAVNNTPDNDAMIFDSANPTGGDTDLATGSQGNILIISEDNDSSDPDDAVGGTITFTFENPSKIFDLKIVDTEEGGTINATLEDGTVRSFTIPMISDGAVDQVILDVEGVVALEVVLNGSGAIDDICYVPGEPAPGSLSGRYFCDTDNDDLDDGQAVDPGIAGVVVTLFDAAGNPVATTSTNSLGEYSFGGLDAGSYSVEFTDPTGVLVGKQLVAPNQGDDDAIDSDAIGDTVLSTIDNITVVAGQDTPDNDAGAEKTASLGDKVFFDSDRDGVQDAGEAGVAGVTVTLTGGGEDGVIGTADDTTRTTVTNGAGMYLFEGLNPGEEYKVTFSDLPAGTEFTVQDAGGDDAADSDADPTNGMTQIVTLAPGEFNDTLDAGIVAQLGSLSGRYFCDDNRDGLDNDGPDNGIAGILVELLDASGVPTGDFVRTDDRGNYSFIGLAPGTYGVKFTDSVSGKVLTTQNVDGDASDDIDSDAEDLGGGMSQITGITVVAGQDTPDNDAGVFPNAPPEATPDMGKGCADEIIFIDVLANDTDPDGDTLSVVEINNQSVDLDSTTTVPDTILINGTATKTAADGTTTTISYTGLEARLTSAGIEFDGEIAFADLGIGEEATDTFTYTVSDGNGGFDESTIDVTFCGYASLETVADLVEGATVTYEIAPVSAPGLADAWTLEITGSDNANIPTGVYTAAYCIDSGQDFTTGVSTTATVLVATEENVALVDEDASPVNAANINAVNWLLNNDQTLVDNGDSTGDTYTDLEVQEAIWLLLNGDTFFINNFPNPQFQDNENGVRDGAELATLENVSEIAMAAQDAVTAGFELKDGDVFGLILEPTDPAEQDQPFIIGIQYECLC